MSKRKIAAVLLGILGLVAVACGSGSASDSAGAPADEGPAIVRAADTFTIDTFTAAGFKKSKEFSTETVPDATSIWYGFYSQRDVEIRFYDSHLLAIGPGVESAAAAVGRSPNSNIGGGIITSTGNRTQYDDFMVAGNAVILCQRDIAPCVELVESIQ